MVRHTFRTFAGALALLAAGLIILGCPTDDDNGGGGDGSTYTVTFDPNADGATVTQTSVKVKAGQAVGELPVPERANFVFIGWRTNTGAVAGGNQVVSGNWGDTVNILYPVNNDMTVYAKWAEMADEFTINFDADGGTVTPSSLKFKLGYTYKVDAETKEPTDEKVYTAEKIGTLPVPTKAGAVFTKWLYDVEGESGLVSTVMTKDTALSGSVAAKADYEQISGKIAALAAEIAKSSHGKSKDDPVVVKVPATITLEDALYTYPNPSDPEVNIKDGLGNLFLAFGGKYVYLDLSDVNWIDEDEDGNDVKIIPANSTAGPSSRPNREYLVGVTLPPNLDVIWARAFSGCYNLRKVDLSGQSKLREIETGAFQNCTYLEEIDFSGCSSLKKIASAAFSGSVRYIPYLDLSETAVETIEGTAFRQIFSAKYIEFPATLKTIGDYAIEEGASLQYVRFRSDTPPSLGWSAFLYFDTGMPYYWSGEVLSNWNNLWRYHISRGNASQHIKKTSAMFVVYHPNTVQWSIRKGSGWEDTGGSYLGAQCVPEGDPIGPGASVPVTPVGDSARDNYRGMASVTVDATGLSADGAVTTNVSGVSGTISGGVLNLTIPAPAASDLKSLDEAKDGQLNAEAITRHYTPLTGGAEDDYYAWPRSNPANANVDWTPRGTGPYYETRPWASDPDANFLVLEIKAGDKAIERAGVSYWKNSANNDGIQTITRDFRRIKYVYVDRDVVITQRDWYNDGNNAYPDPLKPGTTVGGTAASGGGQGSNSGLWYRHPEGTIRELSITLKRGWNQVEYVVRTDNMQDATGANTVSRAGYPLTYGDYVSVWVGAGIIEGASPSVTPVDPADRTFRTLPWVVTESLY